MSPVLKVRRMAAKKLAVGGGPCRERLTALPEPGLLQAVADGFQPLGTFRMAHPRLVEQTAGLPDQARGCHQTRSTRLRAITAMPIIRLLMARW